MIQNGDKKEVLGKCSIFSKQFFGKWSIFLLFLLVFSIVFYVEIKNRYKLSKKKVEEECQLIEIDLNERLIGKILEINEIQNLIEKDFNSLLDSTYQIAKVGVNNTFYIGEWIIYHHFRKYFCIFEILSQYLPTEFSLHIPLLRNKEKTIESTNCSDLKRFSFNFFGNDEINISFRANATEQLFNLIDFPNQLVNDLLNESLPSFKSEMEFGKEINLNNFTFCQKINWKKIDSIVDPFFIFLIILVILFSFLFSLYHCISFFEKFFPQRWLEFSKKLHKCKLSSSQRKWRWMLKYLDNHTNYFFFFSLCAITILSFSFLFLSQLEKRVNTETNENLFNPLNQTLYNHSLSFHSLYSNYSTRFNERLVLFQIESNSYLSSVKTFSLLKFNNFTFTTRAKARFFTCQIIWMGKLIL